MLTGLENGLFALGQVLRLPVMLLLWACVFATVFLLGVCLLELLARRRERADFDLDGWLEGARLLAEDEHRSGLPRPLSVYLRDVESAKEREALDEAALEHLLLTHEESEQRALRTSKILVKVGPSLGLLGTLIPMGSSLAAMAAGNLEAMAGQMVVAFTTTIVGLACGTLAFVLHTLRQDWCSQDVRERRFLAERLAQALEGGA
ncbi:MAG: MotA/TolQ/ExbB proton channel family protein [Acidobacteriota bacterium]